MNLFYLDEDLDKCAEAHVDKHIVKMPLEVAQILCTSIWIDKFLGFVPRALNKEERDIIGAAGLNQTTNALRADFVGGIHVKIF